MEIVKNKENYRRWDKGINQTERIWEMRDTKNKIHI